MGKTGDHCLIAEYKSGRIDAVWCRLFNEKNRGYDYVNKGVSEMAIVVDVPYRNIGIGTKLMVAFYGYLKQKGFPALSLSVDKRNPAVNLYLRKGFKFIRSNENDYFIVKEL